jgi:hypothetical protein
MLGLVDRLAGLGGNAGAGLGGTLGGVLGAAGDALSAPRRMLMNAVGLPESGTELLSKHLGLQADNPFTQGLGFLLEMATDPLSYAGGALGRLGGRAAGAALGSNLEAKALARGPGFAGGLEKLGVNEGITTARARAMGAQIAESPHAAQILGEIPPGSTLMNGSNNALAYRTPQGDVLRIGTEARANIPEMLQPTRSLRAGDINVERLPFASQIGDPDLFNRAYGDLSHSIRQQGFHPADMHPGNIGQMGGQPLLVDPGSVVPRPGGSPLPMGAQTQARSRGGLSDWLLNQLGADDLVQQHLAQVAAPPVAPVAAPSLADRLGRMTFGLARA